MWIYTRYGFYSVTLDPANREQLQVRARSAEDLRNLSHYGLSAKWIKRNIRFAGANRDYPCRIFIAKERWVAVLAAILRDIDYSNFKDAAEDVFPERHDILFNIWATTMRIERGPWNLAPCPPPSAAWA